MRPADELFWIEERINYKVNVVGVFTELLQQQMWSADILDSSELRMRGVKSLDNKTFAHGNR